MTNSVTDGSADILHNLMDVGPYKIVVVRCKDCQRHWVRSVHMRARRAGYGVWLCPAGWRRANDQSGCKGPGRVFQIANRPEIESLWRLTGKYGFGDMNGHP